MHSIMWSCYKEDIYNYRIYSALFRSLHCFIFTFYNICIFHPTFARRKFSVFKYLYGLGCHSGIFISLIRKNMRKFIELFVNGYSGNSCFENVFRCCCEI